MRSRLGAKIKDVDTETKRETQEKVNQAKYIRIHRRQLKHYNSLTETESFQRLLLGKKIIFTKNQDFLNTKVVVLLEPYPTCMECFSLWSWILFRVTVNF